MIARYERLVQDPQVFRGLTGLSIPEFDALSADVTDAVVAADGAAKAARPGRVRAPRSGFAHRLAVRDQVLLVVIWLRQYPTELVLGGLFGVSDPTVSRILARVLPVLAAAGQATMPGPPRQRSRRDLDALLADLPELVVLVDTFEQRVPRPRDPTAQRASSSGKKKAHTIKTQVVVDDATGRGCEIAETTRGPTNDYALVRDTAVDARLPAGCGVIGDLHYLGSGQFHPTGAVLTPRRKPRKRPRPDADVAYNRAVARRRVRVEHTIGRLRRYQALTQVDRHHRRLHPARERAVAGLVNRQLDARLAARLAA